MNSYQPKYGIKNKTISPMASKASPYTLKYIILYDISYIFFGLGPFFMNNATYHISNRISYCISYHISYDSTYIISYFIWYEIWYNIYDIIHDMTIFLSCCISYRKMHHTSYHISYNRFYHISYQAENILLKGNFIPNLPPPFQYGLKVFA